MNIDRVISARSGRRLRAWNFTCLADGGFGDVQNNRAQSMAWFQGRLYVGVTRFGEVERMAPGRGHHAFEHRAVGPGRGRLAPYLGQRGQIWRYDPPDERWQQVLVSPLVDLPNGRKAPREAGYRKMVVFKGPSDPAPALYVTTISPLGGGFLRSQDGTRFSPVSRPELESPETTWSFRALLPFNGRLFTAPAGRICGEFVDRNASEAAVVFENADPGAARWRPVSEIGFGDSTNKTVMEMAALDGFLYAGTINPCKGLQLWKTAAQGPRYRWERVMTDGAFRGDLNQGAASLCAFNGALYIGTGKESAGSGQVYEDESGGAELLRIHPDNTWDLIVGTPRYTFDGVKFPLSRLRPGFDDLDNGVIWEMAEHKGWLYAGTENLSSVLRFLRQGGRAGPAGCNLWRTCDGMVWEPAARAGFGNPNNWGIESMASTPAGLFVGTIGLPARAGSMQVRDWAADSRGGCEVWLGG